MRTPGRILLAEYIDARFEQRQQFAAIVGCSASYLCQIILGGKVPSLLMARRIEIATGGAVPMQSFVPDEDEVVLTDPEPIDLAPANTTPAEPVGA
jgi:hypothetical protein